MASRGLSKGVIALIVLDAVLILVLIALIITHPSPTSSEPDEGPVPPQATEPAEPGPEPEEENQTQEETAPAAEPPEGVLSEPAFVTPSGNIWCEVTADGATCTIGGHDYAIPDQPDCDGHTGRVLQVTEAGATMPCLDQAPPTSATEAHVELDYGESTMVGNFVCASEETGVHCRSLVDDHGFELAYADYDTF